MPCSPAAVRTFLQMERAYVRPLHSKGPQMRRFLVALLGAPVGYIVLASAGYWAIELFSNNAFDRSLEASMTALLVIGPGGAIIGFIAGLVLVGMRRVTRT